MASRRRSTDVPRTLLFCKCTLHNLSPQAHDASEQHGAGTKGGTSDSLALDARSLSQSVKGRRTKKPKILGISRGYRVFLQLVTQTSVCSGTWTHAVRDSNYPAVVV